MNMEMAKANGASKATTAPSAPAPTKNGAVARVRERLFTLQDLEYQRFQTKLMPGVDPATVIGVRMPQLRRIAKGLSKDPVQQAAFFEELPHAYYEESNVHGLAINEIPSFDACIQELERFLPYVDNWATCDLINPKRAFTGNQDRLLPCIDGWLADHHTYTVRFGVGMLMHYFLEDDAFAPGILKRVVAISSDEYYVNMMRAWFIAEALAKQEKATLPLLEQRGPDDSNGRVDKDSGKHREGSGACTLRLDKWTHNKSIQKARESRRISPELKEHLRTLKR